MTMHDPAPEKGLDLALLQAVRAEQKAALQAYATNPEDDAAKLRLERAHIAFELHASCSFAALCEAARERDELLLFIRENGPWLFGAAATNSEHVAGRPQATAAARALLRLLQRFDVK